MNILFVIQSTAIGGITTSLLNLIEYIDGINDNKFNIDIFTFANNSNIEFPKSTNVMEANKNLFLASTSFYDVIKSGNLFSIIKRIFLMLKVRVIGSDKFYRCEFNKLDKLKQYDVAISYSNDIPGDYFNQGTNMFVADFVGAKKKVAWIHTDPIKMGFDKKHCEKVYEKYNRIICVSDAVRKNFNSLFPIFSDKTEVFYNVFNKKQILKQSGEYVPFDGSVFFNIVTVCRIDNETKRVDGIVRLCDRLKKDGVINFKWRIVGDGPSLNKNIRLAKKLNVLDVLEFVGEKKNPYPYIVYSDLFALYSAYEGHPMVIGEAIAADTYILTTNYAAANEQIDSNHGIIALSDEDFYQKIKELIKNFKGKEKDGTFIKRNSSCI